MSDHEIPVKEIAELLDSVTTKVPALIEGLLKLLYSPEAGKNMGQAVGSLYKELIDAGIPKEDALKMAKDYLLSIKDVANGVSKSENKGCD
jgi:hypothetical protein